MTSSFSLNDPLRFAIVHPDSTVRRHLEHAVAAEPDTLIIASVGVLSDAIELVSASQIDVIVADQSDPALVAFLGLDEEDRRSVLVAVSDREHAETAFELGAIDCVCDAADLALATRALQRARRQVELIRLRGLREQLLSALGAAPGSLRAEAAEPAPTATPDVDAGEGFLDRIAVELKGKVRVVQVDEIDYIAASGPYAELHVGDRRQIIRASMNVLERRLDPAVFIRIHRSVIVRLALIETLIKGRGGEYEVQLKSGARLRVSRARREALEARLGVLKGE